MTVDAHDDDQIAQYVAGTLPAGELEAFEQHLLTCERCRAAVRVGAATRAVLLTPATPNAARWRRQLPWLGVAAAAVLIVVVTTRRDDPRDALGDVEPAPFVGGALRPAMDSVTALIDSGMFAYSSSDFRLAAERLQRASRQDSSSAVQFFLGVSRLMSGNAREAISALDRVAPETPYGIEAAYYRAKAWVRLGEPDSAIRALEKVDAGAPLPSAVRSFADSLRRR